MYAPQLKLLKLQRHSFMNVKYAILPLVVDSAINREAVVTLDSLWGLFMKVTNNTN